VQLPFGWLHELIDQLFNHLQHRCSEEEVHDIVTEAVVIEKEFLSEALPVGLIGINADVSFTRSRLHVGRFR
jgi:ribonucleotide reductase beta subunit family protein with ferritin-like domain